MYLYVFWALIGVWNSFLLIMAYENFETPDIQQ